MASAGMCNSYSQALCRCVAYSVQKACSSCGVALYVANNDNINCLPTSHKSKNAAFISDLLFHTKSVRLGARVCK